MQRKKTVYLNFGKGRKGKQRREKGVKWERGERRETRGKRQRVRVTEKDRGETQRDGRELRWQTATPWRSREHSQQ